MQLLKFGRAARCALVLGALAGCAETTDSGTDGAVLPGQPGTGTPGTGTPGTGTPGTGTPGTGTPGVLPDGGYGIDGSIIAVLPDGGVGPVSPGTGYKPLVEPPKGKAYERGWTWVDVPGSKCRDGSGAGYYWRPGTESKLLVYLNGGGACADPFFCALNPVNVNQDLPIELLIGGAVALVAGPDARRQIAPDEGIFKKDPRNPVANWNMIYVPYCTGDIHAGSRENVEIPGVNQPFSSTPAKQQFVGFKNLGLFLESFGPSYKNVDKVLLTGSSAGGFGSLLNYDRFAQYFNTATVYAVSDSGLPFRDKFMAPCLQKRWRTYWNLNDAFPADCTACKGTDGGLTEAAFTYYFRQKYKGKFLGGLVTKVNDQIIRAFYAPGLSATAGAPDDCTLDPTLNTIVGSFGLAQYDGEKYRKGLADVLESQIDPGQVGYYMMPGEEHMHLWRPRFWEKNGNQQTIAEWLKDILDGKPTKQGESVLGKSTP